MIYTWFVHSPERLICDYVVLIDLYCSCFFLTDVHVSSFVCYIVIIFSDVYFDYYIHIVSFVQFVIYLNTYILFYLLLFFSKLKTQTQK